MFYADISAAIGLSYYYLMLRLVNKTMFDVAYSQQRHQAWSWGAMPPKGLPTMKHTGQERGGELYSLKKMIVSAVKICKQCLQCFSFWWTNSTDPLPGLRPFRPHADSLRYSPQMKIAGAAYVHNVFTVASFVSVVNRSGN